MVEPSSAGRAGRTAPVRRDPSTGATTPRAVAYDVLTRVRTDDAYVNLLLPTAITRAGLSGRDAGLVTELVSGTIRMQGAYDTVVDSLTDRSPKPRIRDLIRLGAHQILGMRVPDHAAVSATVALAKPQERGFVNAVLRKVAARTFDEWMDELGADLATRHSHPAWIVAELREALAVDSRRSSDEASVNAQLEALLAADNAPAKVTLVARPGLADRAELPGTPTTLSPYGVVLDEGSPGELPFVRDGRAGVQDEGSQLVAIALIEAPLDGRDERWLDLCAGPGGKSALLAALASGRGAQLVAVERQVHRAGLVVQNLRALPGTPVVAADGTRPPFLPGTFDRVLVDAPCTGLGALRRRPEARWRKTDVQLTRLVELQKALLASALDLVRSGGVVVYATCSPVLAETRGVVHAVVEECAGDVRLEATTQLWPHVHGTDAMFMATLRKSGAL